MKCVQLSWTFRLLKVQFEGILSLCDNVGVGRWRYFNEKLFYFSVVPYQESRLRSKKAKVAIDCKNENPGPLDYSFYKLTKVTGKISIELKIRYILY